MGQRFPLELVQTLPVDASPSQTGCWSAFSRLNTLPVASTFQAFTGFRLGSRDWLENLSRFPGPNSRAQSQNVGALFDRVSIWIEMSATAGSIAVPAKIFFEITFSSGLIESVVAAPTFNLKQLDNEVGELLVQVSGPLSSECHIYARCDPTSFTGSTGPQCRFHYNIDRFGGGVLNVLPGPNTT